MPPPSETESLDALRGWIGRSERRSDIVTAAPLAGLAAMLELGEAGGTDGPQQPGEPGEPAEPATGAIIPPLAHWLYFLPRAPQSALGPDGHPRRGGFLPPVPLPRRMWAGGRLRLHRALAVGDPIQRSSTVVGVEAKRGRSGALVFVTVRHEIHGPDGLAIDEDQDLVYRDRPGLSAPAVAASAAPSDEEFHRRVVPDPVLLFRYSALTFNGHRIHYDRRFATEVEGYPGLVVHGPLIATLLVDLVRRALPEARIQGFHFQAASPLFDLHPFELCGKREPDGQLALWARDHLGQLAMRARAELV
jgi:3-methylfumaryl-CoA hydratase